MLYITNVSVIFTKQLENDSISEFIIPRRFFGEYSGFVNTIILSKGPPEYKAKVINELINAIQKSGTTIYKETLFENEKNHRLEIATMQNGLTFRFWIGICSRLIRLVLMV